MQICLNFFKINRVRLWGGFGYEYSCARPVPTHTHFYHTRPIPIFFRILIPIAAKNGMGSGRIFRVRVRLLSLIQTGLCENDLDLQYNTCTLTGQSILEPIACIYMRVFDRINDIAKICQYKDISVFPEFVFPTLSLPQPFS